MEAERIDGGEPLYDPAPARPSMVGRVRVDTVDGERRTRRFDRIATEEPMEIRVEAPGMPQRTLAVTMRTPGSDFELAPGFLYSEGLIGTDAVVSVRYCAVPREQQHYNVVSVGLAAPVDLDAAQRAFYATSSCGICGKASLEAVEVHCSPVADGPTVAAQVVSALPDALRNTQRIFEQTGGLHACGLFDADGRLLCVREDIGRHNAVDKVIGRALLDGELPLSDRIMMVSGRVSFEIVQKAAMAGVPVICAVSAPSTLAVDAAGRFGITLVGFVRGARFNVYTRRERID